ncbi:MAG: sugar transferase [bacterium]|nr:sugar transferase [bacterium]
MRIRRIDLTFTALLLPLDLLALFGAGIGAYLLRFSRFVTEVRPALQDIPFSEYWQAVSFFVGVWIILFIIAGLYSTRPRRAWNELGRIALACTVGAMVLIASVFFGREFETSRFIVLAVWIFSMTLVSIGRLFLRTIRHSLLKARVGHLNLFVIGDTDAAKRVVDEYENHPILGFTVLHHFKTWNETTLQTAKKIAKRKRADGVLLADPNISRSTALDIIAFAENEHIAFYYLADPFTTHFSNIDVSTATGLPIMEVKRTPLDGWGRIAKRAFDIFFSLLVLIVTSPILLLLVIFIALEDGFPVLFLNPRIGEQGSGFNLYKLRSMYKKFSVGPQFKDQKKALQLEKELIKEKSIKQGPIYKISGDPRITKIGSFVRRWSFDELPQFWNVLTGTMSIVGPRPHQPREVEKYETHHRRVLAIRPGITGLAQISGRSDLTFEDEVRLDIWYIENWSLWLDIYIALKTPFAVIYRKGVY